MRVLFYNHTGEVSGAERMLLLILARLDRPAFEPLVVCPHGPIEKMARDLGVRVETVPILEARFTWRPDQLAHYCNSFLQIIRQIRRRVSQLKPDLIHANSIRSGLVATTATMGMGTRVVWHLHDILPRHPLSSAIRLVALCSNRTRMIAVSEAVARNFGGRVAGLLKSRVSVILNAIDLDKFQSEQGAGHALRKELGLKKQDLVFGIIGQLTPRKGQLELIRAFARAAVPRSVLLIVGAAIFNRDREYALRLTEEAELCGVAERVRLLGSRNDIGAVMQSLDLLIVNSTAEPFGLVIVEAMACGAPVLAASVDGIPEIITHGRNGWLVPPRDEPALAAAIVQLSRDSDLRRRLAQQADVRKFTADRFMTDLAVFYRASASVNEKAAASDGSGRQTETAKFA